MAFEEKAIFTLEIRGQKTDIDGVKGSLEAIEDELRNIKKEAKDDVVAEQFKNLSKVVDESVLSIQELGTAADNYKNIALAAGTESPIGQEAIERAAQLEKEIDTLNRRVADLGEQGRLLKGALDIGTGVVAGYSAAAGAAAFFGEENEELTQTLVKLQAAQSALMGLQELKVLLDKNGTIATIAYTVAEKAKTAATIASQGPMVVLNAIMAANPIGLVVIALGALVAAFLLIPDAIAKLVKWFDNLSTAGKVLAFIFGGPVIAAVIAVRETLKALGVLETEEDLAAKKRHEERVKRLKEGIKERRKLQKEIRKNAKEREKISDEEIALLDFEIRKAKAAGENYVGFERQKIKATKAAIDERIEALENELALETQIAQSRLELADLDNFFSEVSGRTEKITNKILKRSKDLQTQLEQLRNDSRRAEEDLTVFEITEEKKRIDAAKEASEERIENDKREQEERVKSYKAAQEEINKTIAENLKEADRIREEKRNKLIQEGKESIQLMSEQLDAQAERFKYSEEEKKRMAAEGAEERRDIAIALAQVSADISEGLLNLFVNNEQQASEISKAFAVVQLGIDTARAISGAIAAAQSVPFPGNLVAIGTGVATVLKNIDQARKILQDSANVSVPSVSSGSFSSSFSRPSDSNSDTLRSDSDPLDGTPITQTVAIVEDITSAQNRVMIHEERSTV